MVGNRAVTRLVEASSRPESGAAVLAVQREDGKGPEPKDETWGEWAYRHRWKIAGGALLGAVAAAGIYLYAQNSGDSADMKAPEGHPTPDDALKMAQDGLNHAPADAVVPQVESAVEQGAGGLSKLERMGLDITRDTLERVVEKLAGSQVASITAGTVKALNEGLDAAEAFELAHGGDNSVISSLA